MVHQRLVRSWERFQQKVTKETKSNSSFVSFVTFCSKKSVKSVKSVVQVLWLRRAALCLLAPKAFGVDSLIAANPNSAIRNP